jgi:alkyl hydroperoxide reductase subunit AhpC
MPQSLKTILLFFILVICMNNANSQSVVIDEYLPSPIPEVEFYDIGGKNYNFEKFEGNVLLLHFWATWCMNCTQEMKALDQLQKALRKESIIILPISEDFKGAEAVKDFYKKHKIRNLLSFVDDNNELFSAFGATNLPTSFIIDTEGKNVVRIVGAADWQSRQMIELLKSYVHPRESMNADYINVLKEQNGWQESESANKSKEVKDEIPAEAITNIGPAENKEGSDGSHFTNIHGDQFSLKVKRPVNSAIITQDKEEKTDD